MYHAGDPTKSLRKRVEDIHHRTDPLHQPLIAILKLPKRLGLALKYGQDGIDRVTSLHLSRERMVEKLFPSLLLVLAQGGIKD